MGDFGTREATDFCSLIRCVAFFPLSYVVLNEYHDYECGDPLYDNTFIYIDSA